MQSSKLSLSIERLRHALGKRDASVSDGELLTHFVRDRDESAFETLVRRHGPMVFSVCRRILHNRHDAEDAFQASFLVLVSKASALRTPESLANWLYGVAYRTALHARDAAARRRARESEVLVRSELPQEDSSELRIAIDQELERLPENLRLVLLLCDLEGKTRKSVARMLGWPEGTVASRLARGRCLLAKRLMRRGLSLAGGSLAVTIGSEAASSEISRTLLDKTVLAAGLLASGQAPLACEASAQVVTLTSGVLQTMMLTKIKTLAATFALVAILGAGVVGVTYRTVAAEPPGATPTESGNATKQAKKSSKSTKRAPSRWNFLKKRR